MRRSARLRLMRYALPMSEMRFTDPVGYWDRFTSAADSRAALSIACGADPDDVHPSNGTWTP